MMRENQLNCNTSLQILQAEEIEGKHIRGIMLGAEDTHMIDIGHI